MILFGDEIFDSFSKSHRKPFSSCCSDIISCTPFSMTNIFMTSLFACIFPSSFLLFFVTIIHSVFKCSCLLFVSLLVTMIPSLYSDSSLLSFSRCFSLVFHLFFVLSAALFHVERLLTGFCSLYLSKSFLFVQHFKKYLGHPLFFLHLASSDRHKFCHFPKKLT